MPRTPLGEINANPRRGNELDSSLRLRIAGAAECGVSKSQIARTFKIPRSTVRDTI